MTIVKGKVLREDCSLYDGVNTTASREDSTGGVIDGLRINDHIDVLGVYGLSSGRSKATIDSAVAAIGSSNCTLQFSPGTWEITANLTIASNFVCRVLSGCVFNVASGVTLTFSGPVIQDHATWTSGSGTVTTNGTRTINSDIAMVGAIYEAKGADIASATTTDIGAATGNFVDITGTTTITGFGTSQSGTERVCQFDGALVLTHNATSLILPGNANITTAAGDIATFRSLGSGNWQCTSYQRRAIVPIGVSISAIPIVHVSLGGTDQLGVVTSTYTKILFNNELVDTNSNFASSTFTPTVAGKYFLSLNVQINGLTDQKYVQAAIYKNGVVILTHVAHASAATSEATQTNVHGIAIANGTTDYFEGYVYHTHGSNRDIEGSAEATFFSGFWVGP